MAVYSCTSKNHTSTTQTRCAFHQPSCSLVLRVLKHGSLIIWQNSSRSTLLLVAWRSHCKMTDWVVKHIIMLTSFSGKISSNYMQGQVCAITSTISRLASRWCSTRRESILPLDNWYKRPSWYKIWRVEDLLYVFVVVKNQINFSCFMAKKCTEIRAARVVSDHVRITRAFSFSLVCYFRKRRRC